MSDPVKPLFNVPVESGKYRFVQRTNGPDAGLFILRHDKPWVTVTEGSKAIIAMMYELEQAREREP